MAFFQTGWVTFSAAWAAFLQGQYLYLFFKELFQRRFVRLLLRRNIISQSTLSQTCLCLSFRETKNAFNSYLIYIMVNAVCNSGERRQISMFWLVRLPNPKRWYLRTWKWDLTINYLSPEVQTAPLRVQWVLNIYIKVSYNCSTSLQPVADGLTSSKGIAESSFCVVQQVALAAL